MPNKFREPIPVEPFLRWFLARAERYALECGDYAQAYNAGFSRVLEDCGWDTMAGMRRLHRWRKESKTGTCERAMIEDALDHAEVGFWELYPDVVRADEERWYRETSRLPVFARTPRGGWQRVAA